MRTILKKNGGCQHQEVSLNYAANNFMQGSEMSQFHGSFYS